LEKTTVIQNSTAEHLGPDRGTPTFKEVHFGNYWSVYVGLSESDASAQVFRASGVIWSGTCPNLFSVPWASVCHAVRLGRQSFALYSVQNVSLVVNRVEAHQTASCYWVFEAQK